MTKIEAIRSKIKEQGLDAMLLFSPVNIRWATGFYMENGALLVTGGGAWFLTDSRYIEAAREQVQGAEVLLFDQKSRLRDKLTGLLEGFAGIGAEEESLSHAGWNRWQEQLGRELVPAERTVLDLRAVKDAEEKANIIAAQRIAERALDEVLAMLRPGMRERDVAAELTYRMLLHGGEGNSFDPITVTGSKTSVPHGVPGDAVIRAGDFFLMDFGCLVRGYCSDMTRTVVVGKATEEMRRVYQTVLDAQKAGIDRARAGVTGAEIHAAAAAVIADAGYGACFGHGFGHSLGIEIHEEPGAHPRNQKPMPAGAVISAEPGIYLPGKFGVRIEDMLYLTAEGSENLTRAPKNLIEL